jgi:MFS family permease
MSFLALAPINHLMPFYMQNVQHLHVSETSLIFISTTIAIAVTQPFSGRLADRIGSRSIASVGLVLQGLGLVSLSLIPLQINPDWLVPQLALTGVGVGLFRSPNHRALFGAVPRNKMGQAGGYQHLPRQLGESIGETGVVTMFTAIVLTSATLAGLSTITYTEPAPVSVAVATAVPTPAALTGIQPRIPAIAPQQNAAGAAPAAQSAPAGTTIGARGLLDADTSDDLIVDVPDEGDARRRGGELSAAITALPADVQMIGYRIMWALAGVVAFGAAAISYFLRDPETDAEPSPAPTATPAAGAPPRRAVPATSATARP